MSELLERKEYLVGITIIEARNVYGKDAGGTSDPFVKVKCADQVQQSQKKYEQNSAIWNQSLTFNNVMMNEYELETFELIIELYDHNPIFQNELIGQYSIGLSTLHRSLNHEIYKTWIGLFHPEDYSKVQGYLQISCFIVGPNERPPVHSSEDVKEDDAIVDSDEDEEEVIKKIENIKRAQGVMLVDQPNVITKNYQLNVNICKGESIALCPGGSVSPFISVRVNGCVLTTRTINNSQTPLFNTMLQFPINYPILNDKITMRIWSRVSGFSPHHYIANIPEHPCFTDFFNISKLLANDGRMSSRWINLYGADPKDRGPRTKGRREGSEFLGRILLQFSLIPNDMPSLNGQNGNPLKEPKESMFQLWVDAFELIDFKVANPSRDNVWIWVSQGGRKEDDIDQVEKQIVQFKYRQKTNSYLPVQKQLEKIFHEFPMDFNQIPDIFIDLYCNSGESPKTRVGYIRLRAKDVAKKQANPKWMRIKSLYNDVSST